MVLKVCDQFYSFIIEMIGDETIFFDAIRESSLPV